MVPPQTEAPPRTTSRDQRQAGNDKPGPEELQQRQNTASLLSCLDRGTYEKFTEAFKNGQTKTGDGKASGDQTKSLDLDNKNLWGSLSPQEQFATRTTVAGTDRSLKNLSDRLKPADDGKEIPLNSDTLAAKEEFRSQLRERFKGDPRLGTLEALLPVMDQRMLREAPQTADGSILDPQKQLKEVYQSLTDIATKADKLTLKNSQERVFNQSWMIKNMLEDGIIRVADPFERSDQGINNVCTNESILRDGTAAAAGKILKNVASIATTGEFQAYDRASDSTFTCAVDRRSLRPDSGEERYSSLVRGNRRGAFGRVADIGSSQLNEDLISRADNRAAGLTGGEGTLAYVKTNNRINQEDTGERVLEVATGQPVYINPKTGKVSTDPRNGPLLDSPRFNYDNTVNTKDAFYGHIIHPDYARRTTLGAEIRTGAQLRARLAENEAMGWGSSTMRTFADYYVDNPNGLGGAQGMHAFSVRTSKTGNGIDVGGSWGAHKDFRNIDSDQIASWTRPTPAMLAALNPRRGQSVEHLSNPVANPVVNPDNLYTRPASPATDKLPEIARPDKPTPDGEKHEEMARLEKENQERNQKQRSEELRSKEREKQVALAESSRLAAEMALAASDPDKLSHLRAQYEALLHKGLSLST